MQDSLFEGAEFEQLQALRAELTLERTELGEDGENLFSDVRLLRFIRGKDGNIDEAVQQFRDMLRLRSEMGLPELLKSFTGKPWAAESVPGLAKIFMLIGIDGNGFTSEGNLIWIESLGRVNLPEIVEMSDEELMVPMNCMLELRQEMFDRRSSETNRMVKAEVIYDLSGLSVKQVLANMAALSRFKKLLSNWMCGYPESANKVIILDPPAGFSTLFAMISTMLSERTQAKIRFLSGEFEKEIVKVLGHQSLEALARVRASLPLHGDCNIPAGSTEGSRIYRAFTLAQGESLQWAFNVCPEGTDIGMRVLFFHTSQKLEDDEKCHCLEVCRPSLVKGLVEGSFIAQDNGLVWVALSNYHSWRKKKRLESINFTVNTKVASSDAQPA